MKNPEKSKTKRGDLILFLSLLFLINPSVQVVDIFPDFIAYFIIIKRLSYATDRAPYFAEARSALSKLMLISLLKIPAYSVIIFARSGNVGDTDVYALFAFSFAFIEAVFSVIAVYNLFEGAFYLGQRTEAISLIRPFYINKRRTRTSSPDTLKKLLYFFAVYKCAAYGIPELLLLTKTVTESQLKNYFNITKLYPYVILFALASVIVFGIIVLRRAYAYVMQARERADLRSALDSLVQGEARTRLEVKAKVKDIAMTLGVITLASVFMIELRLDNFSLVNIIPHFFMGIILLFALHKLKHHIGGCVATKIALWAFVAVSAVEWGMEVSFLSEYSFTLLASSGLVKREFTPILIVSLLELTCFATAMIFITRDVLKLQSLHTDIGDLTKKKRLYTVGYGVLAVALGAMRYASILLRFFAKNTTVKIENDGMITSGVVTEPLLPWFNVVVIAFTALFIFYSYYLFTSIKEDIEIKYS